MTLDTHTAASVVCPRMGIRISQRSRREFARQLKAWRASRRLSQSQAASRLGLSVRTLQNWEIARTRPTGPTLSLLLKTLSR